MVCNDHLRPLSLLPLHNRLEIPSPPPLDKLKRYISSFLDHKIRQEDYLFYWWHSSVTTLLGGGGRAASQTLTNQLLINVRSRTPASQYLFVNVLPSVISVTKAIVAVKLDTLVHEKQSNLLHKNLFYILLQSKKQNNLFHRIFWFHRKKTS